MIRGLEELDDEDADDGWDIDGWEVDALSLHEEQRKGPKYAKICYEKIKKRIQAIMHTPIYSPIPPHKHQAA